MKLTRADPKVLAGVLICALIAAAVVLKVKLFPSAREADFALTERSLQQVSSGLVVLRPTRFARFHFNGAVSTTVPVGGKRVERMVGRNIPFEQLVAIAYGQPENRVLLPSNAPKTNFDFLITVRAQPRERLQQAIRKQLGFVGRVERHETDVLALSVANPNLPGLTLSAADAQENVESKDGKIQFTHVHLGELTETLEDQLQMPVVDKTGLTNAYDFSLAWDAELNAQQQLRKGSTARTALDEILKGWGLMLKPDTVTLEMLVVKGAD